MAPEMERSSLADGNGRRRRLHGGGLVVAGQCNARQSMDELQQVKVSVGLAKDKRARAKKGSSVRPQASVSSGVTRMAKTADLAHYLDDSNRKGAHGMELVKAKVEPRRIGDGGRGEEAPRRQWRDGVRR
jgi:hypothetical protein